MAADPFASRERYALLVKVQYRFHREIDALYSNAPLDELLPDLGGRRRFDLIELDLADLGLALPATNAPAVFAEDAEANIPRRWAGSMSRKDRDLGAAFC